MDVARKIPVSGSLNKWTFDRFTRGLMAESAVRDFERLNKAHPEVPVRKLMKDVVRDVNIYFGSLGRQGWIQNPTFRDISQLLFLAPQWVEGLVQKESRFAFRLALAPYRMAKGDIAMGTLGRGVGRGLAGYFVLTQILNLITRRQTTFQNKEEGHQLDAWIPTGEESGFWLSPMSVFAEVAHDVMRLSESKPNTFEAVRQIGLNKLGPWGRMAVTLITREGRYGQRLSSTGAVMAAAAGQLVPTPISLSAPGRALGHAIMPGTISPPPQGALQRQALAAVGVKVQPGTTPEQSMTKMAQDFVRREGLASQTVEIIPTDEPSYYKLRSALRNDDLPKARKMLEALKETHTEDQIISAMQLWSKRPFTGSAKNEPLFLSSLDDKELERYFQANLAKQNLFNKFVDFYLKEP